MKLNEIEHYEILAHAFKAMTGFMAPGKEPAMDSFEEPIERRQEAWRHWKHTHERVINAIVTAFCYVMPDETPEPGEPRDWDQPTLEAFVENNYWHNPEDAIGDIRLFINKHRAV
jgi:hypothetical protein